MEALKVGDWIKARVIGLGYYEVVSIDEFHINLKCLRLFMNLCPGYRGHVTNIHHGLDHNGVRIKLNQNYWFKKKVNRLNYKCHVCEMFKKLSYSKKCASCYGVLKHSLEQNLKNPHYFNP